MPKIITVLILVTLTGTALAKDCHVGGNPWYSGRQIDPTKEKELSLPAFYVESFGKGEKYSGMCRLRPEESTIVVPNGFDTEAEHPDLRILPAESDEAKREKLLQLPWIRKCGNPILSKFKIPTEISEKPPVVLEPPVVELNIIVPPEVAQKPPVVISEKPPVVLEPPVVKQNIIVPPPKVVQELDDFYKHASLTPAYIEQVPQQQVIVVQEIYEQPPDQYVVVDNPSYAAPAVEYGCCSQQVIYGSNIGWQTQSNFIPAEQHEWRAPSHVVPAPSYSRPHNWPHGGGNYVPQPNGPGVNTGYVPSGPTYVPGPSVVTSPGGYSPGHPGVNTGSNGPGVNSGPNGPGVGTRPGGPRVL